MLRVSGNTALFLDIDGTILDMARTPEAVVVPAALLRALEVLRKELGGAVAFVSGRARADIDKLFAPFRPAAIGSHGGEIRDDAGLVSRAAPLPPEVTRIFRELASAEAGLLLEDKGCALALHYRLAPAAEPRLEAAMAEHKALFAAEKIDILFGKAVIDARHRGIDKGSAVSRLAAQKPFAGRSLLFGGDDTTDEDVFRILPELGGQGFSVGRSFPGAAHMFESPQAVRQWLVGLAQAGVAP
jgi:trehalose 6-phosphate phosphatase